MQLHGNVACRVQAQQYLDVERVMFTVLDNTGKGTALYYTRINQHREIAK